MSRMEKLKRTKTIKRTIIYPFIIFLGIMIMFLFIVDYRVNNSLGRDKIQLVEVKKQSDTKYKLAALGDKGFVLDIAYIRRDYNRLKNNVIVRVKRLENSAKEVIKEY